MLETLSFAPEEVVRAILVAQANRLTSYAENAYDVFKKSPNFGGFVGSSEISIHLRSLQGIEIILTHHLVTDPFSSVVTGEMVKNMAVGDNNGRPGVPLFLQTGFKTFSFFNNHEDLLHILDGVMFSSEEDENELESYQAFYDKEAILFKKKLAEDYGEEEENYKLVYWGDSLESY